MKKEEAKMTPRVNKWVRSWIPESTPWDVKHTRGADRFDLREIKDHQRDYLEAATTEHGFVFKIEDAGYSAPPCDTVCFKNAKLAGLAIVFPSVTYYVPILSLRGIDRPSLTEEEVDDLAYESVANSLLPK